MSLISIQNFVAPFKSKTHLVTLVIVAVVFGAFRMSGGGVSTTTRIGKRLPSNLVTREVITPPVKKNVAPTLLGDNDAAVHETEQTQQESVPRKSENLIDDITSDNTDSSKSGSTSDLDEIERKLGLR